jgi:hypothetical protein
VYERRLSFVVHGTPMRDAFIGGVKSGIHVRVGVTCDLHSLEELTPQRVNPNFCEFTKIILQSPSKLLVELLQMAHQ